MVSSKNKVIEKIVIAKKKECRSLLTSMLLVYKLKDCSWLEKLIFARKIAFGNGETWSKISYHIIKVKLSSKFLSFLNFPRNQSNHVIWRFHTRDISYRSRIIHRVSIIWKLDRVSTKLHLLVTRNKLFANKFTERKWFVPRAIA